MCFSKPSIPRTATPQEAKQPDIRSLAQARRTGFSGGTLLTSPTGITPGALSTGTPKLLGQ